MTKPVNMLISVLALGCISILASGPARAASPACDCYMEGYTAGAYGSGARIPKHCLIRGKTQMPGQSTWSYQTGRGYGLNIESRKFASTRARNRKWTQDRIREHQRHRRLLCGY